jgi:hypothetical protein
VRACWPLIAPSRSVPRALVHGWNRELTKVREQETNVYNSNVSEIVELWTTYTRNVRFNLESTNTLEEPI